VMKNAQQKRRHMMSQPTDGWFVVNHVPAQMPEVTNVGAMRDYKELLLHSHRASKRRAQSGGQARAETFRAWKEQAEQTARTIWSAQPDLSCRAMSLMVAQRAGHSVSARTIRRWIAPLRPSTQ